jgi:hypothetical protein
MLHAAASNGHVKGSNSILQASSWQQHGEFCELFCVARMRSANMQQEDLLSKPLCSHIT